MKDAIESELKQLANELIEDVTRRSLEIREGVVMTIGPLPYRRLDCDGRALAYIRARPRKRAVRVDVSGLWLTPNASTLGIPNAGGSATLVVHTEPEMLDAAEYLAETVRRTRATYPSDSSLSRRPARPLGDPRVYRNR